jgi:hypothetical protein
MKPKQAFGLAVRVIGLMVILVAVLYFVSAFVVLIDPTCRPNLSPSWQYFAAGVGNFLIGLYLLRGASHVVNFAYPDEDSESKPDSN